MNSAFIVVLAFITFANRFAFFSDSLRYTPGPRVTRFLSYSSYAVLTAIWTPIVFSYSQEAGFSIIGIDYVVGVSLAAVLAIMKVRSILVVLLSTGVFFTLRFML